VTDRELPGLTAHELQNQASWDADSDAYQERHGGDLATWRALAAEAESYVGRRGR
jgi:hypothetical protein